MTKRAAIYLRVSTDGQTTDNQRLALEQVAKHRGWHIVETYTDHGISGAKARDKRPAFDSMCTDATRGKFDVIDGVEHRPHRQKRQHVVELHGGDGGAQA